MRERNREEAYLQIKETVKRELFGQMDFTREMTDEQLQELMQGFVPDSWRESWIYMNGPGWERNCFSL